MTTLLKAEGLTKAYKQGADTVYAVKRADFSIEKGECVAIIGPSGAGKSTLLHMIGALDTPSEGSVAFQGQDLYRLNDKKRSALRNKKIGFIFQFYNLLGDLSLVENIMMPAFMAEGFKGKKTIRRAADELVDKVGLTHRRKHRPSELSGGEQQRVAIARALINQPDILLCDEPTGNLDSNMRTEIYDIIYTISRGQDMSVVIVTHNDYNVLKFDKTYFMRDGVINIDGSV